MNINDFNFKLVLVNSLMYSKRNQKPSFENEYNEVLNSLEYQAEYDEISRNYLYENMCQSLYNYLQNLEIPEEDLDKIEVIYIDGGSQIYADLAPSWDGESKIFDINSFDGIENLKNLKKIDVESLSNKAALEKVQALNCEVYIDKYLLK